MIDYVGIAIVILLVVVFGLWLSRLRMVVSPVEFSGHKRSLIPLIVCLFSFCLSIYLAADLFSSLGLLASIFFGVVFLILFAPVEYFVIRNYFELWLSFYRVDDIFFPYFSAGLSMGWVVGRVVASS